MSERSDCSSWCLMVSVIWICALGTGVSNTFSDTSVCRLSHWSISAQVFCPLCRWAFFFLFLNWKGSLYILDPCSSLAGTFANTSPCLPFSESFFCSAEVYFNEINWQSSLMDAPLELCLRSCRHPQIHPDCLLSPGSFVVLSFPQIYDGCEVMFCDWGEVCVQVLFYLVFSV